MAHPLIEKFFRKKGIKGPEELDDTAMPDGSPNERQTVERWKAILSKEKLTTDDIEEFCRIQIETIEAKWNDLTLEQTKKAELIPYHVVYKRMLVAISSPLQQRQALEKQLTEMLK